MIKLVSKRSIPLALRKLVWNTYIGKHKGTAKCQCCNHEEIQQLGFHAGHVIPFSRGGTTSIENLRPICESCNKSMGFRDMREFMATHSLGIDLVC